MGGYAHLVVLASVIVQLQGAKGSGGADGNAFAEIKSQVLTKYTAHCDDIQPTGAPPRAHSI